MNGIQKPQEISKKERREIKRRDSESARAAAAKRGAQKGYGIVAIVALFVAAGGYWWWHWGPRPNTEAFDPATVCTTDPRTVMHIHPHLTIIIGGKDQEIPQGVGIASPTCMRPMHTHDPSGIIHIESPVVRDYTLGEFFRVWDKPFDRTHILDKIADENHQITMTVDGKKSDAFETLILEDNQRIVISYKSVEK